VVDQANSPASAGRMNGAHHARTTGTNNYDIKLFHLYDVRWTPVILCFSFLVSLLSGIGAGFVEWAEKNSSDESGNFPLIVLTIFDNFECGRQTFQIA
jgi:hypothetical protein